MKPTIINIFILVLSVFTISSCSKQDKATSTVREWQEKQIHLPEDPFLIRFSGDSTFYTNLNNTYPNYTHQILIYVDSIGCLSCKLKLAKWKEIISLFDSLTNNSMSYLFVFDTKNIERLKEVIDDNKFNYPVLIDTNGDFNRLNHFPADDRFQTFLLNRDHKVLIIGNPVHNITIKDLYIKEITGNKNPRKKSIETTANAISDKVDLGVLTIGERKDIVFEILNTGNNPLIIVDSNASCNCTDVSYSKESINPGDRIQIKVEFTPKSIGLVNESIIIKCNTPNNIKLHIKGEVK